VGDHAGSGENYQSGVFVISPLPPFVVREMSTAGCLHSTDVTPLQSYHTPILHPLAFNPLPGVAGYRVYLAPVISPWGEEGFSSCLAYPGHRAVATTPLEWSDASVSLRRSHAVFALRLRARPPELRIYEATSRSLALRPAALPIGNLQPLIVQAPLP
jgi:hypothetical protein